MIKIPSKQKAFFAFGIPALSAALLAGCNLYSFIDKPKGDEQILSAARACFDRADFACAREYYAQLSSSYADIQASEEAFMILAENGAGMAAFMETFGSGGSGEALTSLAERMAPGSETKRLAIQEAFQKYDQISDTSLKALVRFVASTALAAEFLAEEIPTAGGALTKSMIANGGTNCTTSNPACAADADCGEPAGAAISDAIAGDGFNFVTTSLASTTLDLGHFRSIMTEMADALNNLGATGNFGSGAGGLSDDISNEPLLDDPAVYQCFRSNLLNLGIGR